jgi:hypothetical protein
LLPVFYFYDGELTCAKTYSQRNIVNARVTKTNRFIVREPAHLFTRGRFDSGGRPFVGFWQNMPKAQRLNLTTLNDDPVVSLDHSALGVRLVYALARKPMPEGDAYAVDEVRSERATLKRLMSACLEALRATPAIAAHLFTAVGRPGAARRIEDHARHAGRGDRALLRLG